VLREWSSWLGCSPAWSARGGGGSGRPGRGWGRRRPEARGGPPSACTHPATVVLALAAPPILARYDRESQPSLACVVTVSGKRRWGDWFLNWELLFAAAGRRDGDDPRVDAGQQCPGGQGAAGPEAEEQEGGRHQEVDLPPDTTRRSMHPEEVVCSVPA